MKQRRGRARFIQSAQHESLYQQQIGLSIFVALKSLFDGIIAFATSFYFAGFAAALTCASGTAFSLERANNSVTTTNNSDATPADKLRRRAKKFATALATKPPKMRRPKNKKRDMRILMSLQFTRRDSADIVRD